MLVLPILFIVCAALAAPEGETPPEQEAAVKELRGKASNIHMNRDGTVRFVRFSKAIVTDEHLAHVSAFKQLDYLAVVTSAVTDKGLLHASQLTNLDSLVLTYTQLTNAGLKILEGSKDKLELLYLDRTKITSAGLPQLKQLSAIRILWLAENDITDEGIANLSELKTLEVLNLSGTKVTDAALSHLSKLEYLKGVYLDRTKITGATIEQLVGLPNLEFLSLAGTQLDAKHLAAIAKSKSLKQVNLYSTSITRKDIDQVADTAKTLTFTLAKVHGHDKTAFQRFMAGEELRAAPQHNQKVKTPSQGSTAAAKDVAQVMSEHTPDFQRHVMPLLGNLGCNGRACHGSFQGQGGFSLSMFGYDFDADLKELTEADTGRVDLKSPLKSLILRKPAGLEDHGGDKRFEPNGWEYKAIQRWIADGASGKPELDKLVSFQVTPSEFVFTKPGESVQLRVFATWHDGTREDVTRLTRFEVKDDQVADVARDGLVTCKSSGDTHVLAMYDKGVRAIPVMMPISDRTGENFPDVATPTKIDELVVDKLSKLGIVPSELSTDTDFLRRVYIDVAGTLPSPKEIKEFLADNSSSKREAVIEKLLNSEAYTTWWGLWLADLTGSNTSVLGGTNINWAASAQWAAWLKQRVKDNDGWDKTAAGMLLASSRPPNQSFDEYAAFQSRHLARKEPLDSSRLDFPMHHYWFHGMRQQPIDRALSIGYVFMGVRLQCAQCHKHPFDQRSKQDFDQFSNFFARVRTGREANACQTSWLRAVRLERIRGSARAVGGVVASER